MSKTVFITPKADQKLSAYLRLADEEISGFGSVVEDNGRLLVEDIFILDQESGAAHTEMDADALHNLLNELLQTGKDPESIGLWFHSHGHGLSQAPSFSGTDYATIERIGLFGRAWMLHLVSDQQLQHTLQLDYYRPMRIKVTGLTLKLQSEANERIERQIAREIARKVRKPVYVSRRGPSALPSIPHSATKIWNPKTRRFEEEEEEEPSIIINGQKVTGDELDEFLAKWERDTEPSEMVGLGI